MSPTIVLEPFDVACRHEGSLLKALLKLLTGTGALAASAVVTVVVQSVSPYGSIGQPTPSSTASVPAKYVPHTSIYGISTDPVLGRAVITLTPFTSSDVARALGRQYGMDLLDSEPAFGRFTFTLPQIRIGPGPVAHTATVYFPPNATSTDLSAYLNANGLQVVQWLSTSDQDGRVVVVTLPQIKPVLVDSQHGIWKAVIATGIDRARVDEWSKANGLQVIGYDSKTGVILIQGPKPRPVYQVVRKPIIKTTTSTPATTKVYIAFQPGTTFNQAQTAIQNAGGQLTSYNSATELAVANVATTHVSQTMTALRAAPQVSCVSGSSTACASTVPSSTSGSTTTTTDTHDAAGDDH